MNSGIRAEIRIESPGDCPIAEISATTGAETHSISRSAVTGTGGRTTEEFLLDHSGALDEDRFERVFSYGSRDVYRFDREEGVGCACECVEQFDCPVADVSTRNGSLHLVFHAPGMDPLKDAISALREQYDGVTVLRLLRSSAETDEHELVLIDRGELTGRQLECLRTAHDMGYFAHPKGANAGEVAEELGITTSTFTEHLAAAQSKLLSSILDA